MIEKKSKVIIEVNRRDKSAWVRAANRLNLKLSAYVIAVMNGKLVTPNHKETKGGE